MIYLTTIWKPLYEHDGDPQSAKRTGVWICDGCGFIDKDSAMADTDRWAECLSCGLKFITVAITRETIENVLRD